MMVPAGTAGEEVFAAAMAVPEGRRRLALQEDRGEFPVFIAFTTRAAGSHPVPAGFNKLKMHHQQDRRVSLRIFCHSGLLNMLKHKSFP